MIILNTVISYQIYIILKQFTFQNDSGNLLQHKVSVFTEKIHYSAGFTNRTDETQMKQRPRVFKWFYGASFITITLL